MNDIKNWINERQTLRNEIVADELYAYLKDRVEECGNYNGRVTYEVILSLVGSYGFVVLKDQELLEKCSMDRVFRLVDSKGED